MTARALLAHGAGSCPETVRRLLATAAPDGADVLAIDARGTVEEVVARLEHAAGSGVVLLVGGVSLGAHAAALWASRTGATCDLVLAMPAWTGRPGDVAGLTARTAEEIAERGTHAVLAEIAASAEDGDWVVEELRRGWAAYDDGLLARTLLAAATSPGPTRDELSRIVARTVVVGLADDPMHPLDVAREWSASVPRAGLVVVPRQDPATDRGALGRSARRTLDALG